MTEWHTELEFKLKASVSISEGHVREDGFSSTEALVEVDSQEVDLEFGCYHDEQFTETVGYGIAMDFFHAINKETNRRFHCHIDTTLNMEELKKLHAFVGFLISLQETK